LQFDFFSKSRRVAGAVATSGADAPGDRSPAPDNFPTRGMKSEIPLLAPIITSTRK
jgi:hypothetical protein